MQTVLLLPLIYYFIGICYTYEEYKKLDGLDFMSTSKQMFIAYFIYPTFWIVFWSQPRVKKLKNWIAVKKSHYYNRIIR